MESKRTKDRQKKFLNTTDDFNNTTHILFYNA